VGLGMSNWVLRRELRGWGWAAGVMSGGASVRVSMRNLVACGSTTLHVGPGWSQARAGEYRARSSRYRCADSAMGHPPS